MACIVITIYELVIQFLPHFMSSYDSRKFGCLLQQKLTLNHGYPRFLTIYWIIGQMSYEIFFGVCNNKVVGATIIQKEAILC